MNRSDTIHLLLVSVAFEDRVHTVRSKNKEILSENYD